ncbi:MAG: hypothetical protein HKN33_09810 [Pyrinomonadaceae bacterium]|nr:hypothetical protein [Pyrinomonadaceae bacterium]
MKRRLVTYGILLFLVLSSFEIGFGQTDIENEVISTTFNEETDLTVVMLNGIEIPKNKDKFSVGALFFYAGKEYSDPACCIQLFFTSLSQKNFKYKEKRDLTVWVDAQAIEFGEMNWQESPHATAFIIAEIFWAEEMFVSIDKEELLKIARAGEIRVRIGDFKFNVTDKQISGLRELADKLEAGPVTQN